MGAIGGPNKVEDGLVLALDGANVKSFRGEPTTNVVTNSLPTSGWGIGNFGGSTITRSFLTENSIPFMRFSGVINASDYPRVTDSVFSNSATITGTFSTSFEARGTPGSQIRLRLYENGSTKITNTATLTSDWVRYTFENQSTAFLLNQPYFNPVTTGATYDIRNIQIEAKPYATPFVNGTRGTTVATGGGWADLSNTSNHGELVNGPTFSSGNLGSISFDGVDDYISTNQSFNTNQFTYETWLSSSNISKDQMYVGASVDAFYLRIVSSAAFLSISANGQRTLTHSQTLQNNTIYQIVSVYNGVQLKIYVNGLLTTGSVINQTMTRWGGNRIGRWRDNDQRSFVGSVFLMNAYDRELTSTEIQQNYNATKGRFGL